MAKSTVYAGIKTEHFFFQLTFNSVLHSGHIEHF